MFVNLGDRFHTWEKVLLLSRLPADIVCFAYLLKYTFAVLPGRASAEDSTARQPCWALGGFIF